MLGEVECCAGASALLLGGAVARCGAGEQDGHGGLVAGEKNGAGATSGAGTSGAGDRRSMRSEVVALTAGRQWAGFSRDWAGFSRCSGFSRSEVRL
jgi:hypothetical protein